MVRYENEISGIAVSSDATRFLTVRTESTMESLENLGGDRAEFCRQRELVVDSPSGRVQKDPVYDWRIVAFLEEEMLPWYGKVCVSPPVIPMEEVGGVNADGEWVKF